MVHMRLVYQHIWDKASMAHARLVIAKERHDVFYVRAETQLINPE